MFSMDLCAPGCGDAVVVALRGELDVADAAAAADNAPLAIQVHTPQAGFIQRCGSAEEHRDHLGQLADAGVDSFVLRPPGDDLDRTVEALHRYAETFLKG